MAVYKKAMNTNLSTSDDDLQLAQLVRTTLQAATQPAPGQLRALMPPPPKVAGMLRWQRQWAVAVTCICLALLGLSTAWLAGSGWQVAPPPLAATATHTNVPTSTLAETTVGTAHAPRETAVATRAASAATATPAPNPTPIAALPPAAAH